MNEVSTRLPPPDEAGDVTPGEVMREVAFFAAVVGFLAGGCYGLVVGYQDWKHVVPTVGPKTAWVIPLWGLGWGLAGSATLGVACGLIVAAGTALIAILRKIVQR